MTHQSRNQKSKCLSNRWSMFINKKIDRLEELSVCVILLKAIEKLKTVQQLLPNSDVKWDEPFQVMSDRMTTLQKIRPPEDEEPRHRQNFNHIQKFCSMSQQALEKVTQEVKAESHDMLDLLKYVLFTENLRYYDNFLLKQENLNLNNTIQNLKDQINEVKKNSLLTSNYLGKIIEVCLNQAAVTAWAQSETHKRNTEVIQKARMDQNSYKLMEKEDNVSNITEQLTSEMAKEDLINSEITNHLQTVISALQKKFEKWTARYSEEIDALDITLLQLRSKMDEQQEKLATMSENYAARQELVDVLQEESDERDREEELRLAQLKAALIIQRWWRKIIFMRLVLRGKPLVKKNKKNSPKIIKDMAKKKKK